MRGQLGLNLAGGFGLLPEMPLREGIGRDDPMPAGPYAVGLTHWQAGDGRLHDSPPFTVTCGDGRAIAGHIESRDCAEAIVAALNRVCCPADGEAA